MSNVPETNADASGNPLFPPDWKAQVKLYGGRKGFIRQELKRLGFWPPAPGSKYKWVTQKEEAELEELYNNLVELRRPLLNQLGEVDKQIAGARQQIKDIGNTKILAAQIEELIVQIRAARIARVKKERAERKIKNAQEREARAAKDKAWRGSTLPHLGQGVSSGLDYNDSDDDQLSKFNLPILKTAEDVAGALGLSTGKLAWLTYHRGATTIDHYHHFQIPKKSGGMRDISAPKKELKAAQNWILENVLSRVSVHESAAAFLPGKNIADNASRHAAPEVLLRIDLKDFFPSISFKRVKKVFGSLGYNEGVSTLFALLSTEAPRVELSLDGKKYFVAVSDRFLPQGASTSPALTNILCRNLDARLSGAAKKLDWEYSRYADDLVFSSKSKNADARSLQNFISQIIEDEKFQINPSKTAVMRAHRRQSVTGLVVNAAGGSTPFARVSRRDLKSFRAFLHHYEKRGREAMTEQIGQDALSYARGYWAFIFMCDPQGAAKIRAKHNWLQKSGPDF